MPKEIKINRGLNNLLVEIFELTEEQLAALDHQIPMTQEIYDSMLDRCTELGSRADDLFNRLLIEYPEFLMVYGQRIIDEVKANYKGEDMPNFEQEREAILKMYKEKVKEMGQS